MLGTLAFLGGPSYAAHYAPYFTAHPGELPISGIENLGIIGGNIKGYSGSATAYDQSNGNSSQWSAELRFNSNFDGPVNFLAAAYYLNTKTSGDYFVNSNTLDYPAMVLGSFVGLTAPSLCYATGCILGPSFYHNVGNENTLSSTAAFGEVYWEAIPDELKFTGGLRWTEDEKFQQGRIELFSGLVPIGSNNEKAAMVGLVNEFQRDFDCSNGSTNPPGGTVGCGTAPAPGPNDVWQNNSVRFDKLTGRLVADWTPKLDGTDTTHLYASYARGYKAGGFNPGIEAGLDVPFSYKPESIDAFEVGSKNTLFDNQLQAQPRRLVLQLQGPSSFGDREQHLGQSEHQCQALGRGRRVQLCARRELGIQFERRHDPIRHHQQ